MKITKLGIKSICSDSDISVSAFFATSSGLHKGILVEILFTIMLYQPKNYCASIDSFREMFKNVFIICTVIKTARQICNPDLNEDLN